MVGSSDKVKNMFKKKFPSLSSLGSDGNTSFLRAARAGHLDKVLEQLRNNVDINTSNANGLNALHLASKDGHVHVVTELLKRGANVDSATKKGNTALHIASLAGQEEVVRLLVEHGAAVNVQSQNGFTPLYMAAQENHDSVVKYLLANGANQSLATEDGFTPLAVAMQQGHDKVVAVLLENDTRGKVRLPALHIAAKKDDCKAAALLLQNEHNPDVTSKSGFTPLHIASHYGNEGIAILLLNKGADVNYSAKHNITPLHVAAKWGKSNMVSLLLEKGANIESKTRDGLTPLHCAARSGHEQVVDMLLERGAPISCKTKNGLAPLHMSSQGDHVDAARILLYHRAPVDEVTVDYLTALHVAAHCGHARVAKLLLDRKADPNARALNGFTPLHIACKKNRIKVVELLLKHGASIEATTESGLTPLHVASFMGCMNIVIYLLQNDASPDVPTVRGETPLHLAARANQTDIIRILLRNGAQVDARAREQQTALHIASRLGNVDIAMLLLQHGASADCTTKDLYSALHIAAKEGQDEVASVLLENGASATATTKKGFTPLHLAAKYGNMKVAKLLLQRDAPVDAQGKNGVTPLHVASHYDHQNVALLLLDKGASPHATAKNGHTPLHIAARKNQMDIATTLLEYGAKANAESKAGFTPLHLSAQEGHMDMSSLLIDHQADTNDKAKNGLTPLHLCAQEDRTNVASILVKNGAEVDATTKAGYTPLHVACHFGQLNMVRFLLEEGSKVDSATAVGYTPLHQAAQQGHCAVVNTLLEHGAPPNATTNQGQTAMSIAQKLGYISVVESLKGVTDVTTITPLSSEEKYKVVSPETMQETFMSDSEDEGGEDTLLSEQPYRYLTVDEMKSLGDDSLPIDVRQDERMDSNRECMSVPPTAQEDSISPAHMKESYSHFNTPDNIDISKHPLHIGFLVSFLVDARGGAMRGCRHSGVRVIVPPRRASMPMRVTCRYLRRDKLTHPPPLMEGEALASRILELGPVGAKFLGPVMIEVPHFGSLRGKEREIVILRSDNGETWREHTVDCSEEAVQDVLSHSFEKEDMVQLDESGRTTRILTTDFPHYFAVVTRVRQEVHAIGPEGGMVSSSVVPQVQAVFPQGALTKKIKVGLQAQPISAELAAKLLGNRVAVSPIVTVEPRRRKFHKPITLTIPKPQAANKGMINQYSGDAPTLRLLCSITGGTTRAQWEDVTGSTPFTFVNDCVSFTTTVSARFWLMDCRNVGDATKMATELYREAIHVPFMAKFVVFAKRVDPLEARLRIFCMTDDKEDKTLEHQEHFTEVAKSRDVEVLEGKTQYVEFAGNLVPVTKSGEQLQLSFRAFRENRLPFTVRVKDPHADCVGRTLFMREARLPKGEAPQQPICVLNIVLPEEIIPEAILPEHELHKYSFIQDSSGLESYQRVELRLSDISNLLGEDWVRLAEELGVAASDITRLQSEHPQSVAQQGLAMLRLWLSQAGNKAQASTLESALTHIGRDDIVQQCVFNVDQSGLQLLKDESRDASLRRSIPYSNKEILRDSEQPDNLSRSTLRKTGQFQEKDDKEERKYEAEEKEVEEVKKSVTERRKDIEKRLSMEKQLDQKAESISLKLSSEQVEDLSEKEIAEEKRVSSPEEEPSEMSFAQKRLSFEQGKRVIEMKPDKMTMKEVNERAMDEKFLAEERLAAETLKEKKSMVDETSIPFSEKRKSFEEKEKKVKSKKEDLRKDTALFEGVSQGLVHLDAAFTATPQVQDLLTPKVSKTPPPSPAEFKDLTGTAAWTDQSQVAPTAQKDQSQDWTEKGTSDSAIEPSSNKGSSNIVIAQKSETFSEDNKAILPVIPTQSQKIIENIDISTRDDVIEESAKKESKYQFTMSAPNKETFSETLSSIKTFLEAEKLYNNEKVKYDKLTTGPDIEATSSDDTEVSLSKSESESKSDKSFVGKMSKKIFRVFKKDDKGELENKKGKKHKPKRSKDSNNELQNTEIQSISPADNHINKDKTKSVSFPEIEADIDEEAPTATGLTKSKSPKPIAIVDKHEKSFVITDISSHTFEENTEMNSRDKSLSTQNGIDKSSNNIECIPFSDKEDSRMGGQSIKTHIIEGSKEIALETKNKTLNSVNSILSKSSEETKPNQNKTDTEMYLERDQSCITSHSEQITEHYATDQKSKQSMPEFVENRDESLATKNDKECFTTKNEVEKNLYTQHFDTDKDENDRKSANKEDKPVEKAGEAVDLVESKLHKKHTVESKNDNTVSSVSALGGIHQDSQKYVKDINVVESSEYPSTCTKIFIKEEVIPKTEVGADIGYPYVEVSDKSVKASNKESNKGKKEKGKGFLGSFFSRSGEEVQTEVTKSTDFKTEYHIENQLENQVATERQESKIKILETPEILGGDAKVVHSSVSLTVEEEKLVEVPTTLDEAFEQLSGTKEKHTFVPHGILKKTEQTVDDGKSKVIDTSEQISGKMKKSKGKSKSFFGSIFSKTDEIGEGKTKIIDSTSLAYERSTEIKGKPINTSKTKTDENFEKGNLLNTDSKKELGNEISTSDVDDKSVSETSNATVKRFRVFEKLQEDDNKVTSNIDKPNASDNTFDIKTSDFSDIEKDTKGAEKYKDKPKSFFGSLLSKAEDAFDSKKNKVSDMGNQETAKRKNLDNIETIDKNNEIKNIETNATEITKIDIIEVAENLSTPGFLEDSLLKTIGPNKSSKEDGKVTLREDQIQTYCEEVEIRLSNSAEEAHDQMFSLSNGNKDKLQSSKPKLLDNVKQTEENSNLFYEPTFNTACDMDTTNQVSRIHTVNDENPSHSSTKHAFEGNRFNSEISCESLTKIIDSEKTSTSYAAVSKEMENNLAIEELFDQAKGNIDEITAQTNSCIQDTEKEIQSAIDIAQRKPIDVMTSAELIGSLGDSLSVTTSNVMLEKGTTTKGSESPKMFQGDFQSSQGSITKQEFKLIKPEERITDFDIDAEATQTIVKENIELSIENIPGVKLGNADISQYENNSFITKTENANALESKLNENAYYIDKETDISKTEDELKYFQKEKLYKKTLSSSAEVEVSLDDLKPIPEKSKSIFETSVYAPVLVERRELENDELNKLMHESEKDLRDKTASFIENILQEAKEIAFEREHSETSEVTSKVRHIMEDTHKELAEVIGSCTKPFKEKVKSDKVTESKEQAPFLGPNIVATFENVVEHPSTIKVKESKALLTGNCERNEAEIASGKEKNFAVAFTSDFGDKSIFDHSDQVLDNNAERPSTTVTSIVKCKNAKEIQEKFETSMADISLISNELKTKGQESYTKVETVLIEALQPSNGNLIQDQSGALEIKETKTFHQNMTESSVSMPKEEFDSRQSMKNEISSKDDKLNTILIDMLIEQESIKPLVVNQEIFNTDHSKSSSSSAVSEKHDLEDSEKPLKKLSACSKTAASYGEIESLLKDHSLSDGMDENLEECAHSSYVTTPTMERRKIGGSQRLSREERPALREIAHIQEYCSSDEEASNLYTVTEPTDKKITFHVDSDDDVCHKIFGSDSEPELVEVTEITSIPIAGKLQQNFEQGGKSFLERTETGHISDKDIKKVERRFERMASETLEADPKAKYTVDREFQRMISQLSNEEVDACLDQWDEGGLTPSEELDSTRDTAEGDLDPDVEALPEAFQKATNPFFSPSTQWVDFEQDFNDKPSSVFWAFDTTPTSTVIRPNELDIPIKPVQVQGDSAGEELSQTPMQTTTREGEEALMDLAAGLQDPSKGTGPSGTK